MSGSITNFGLLNAPISYKATRNPGVSDDISKGFAPTSLWLNSSTNKIYIAFSVVAGAAQWVLLNPAIPTPPASNSIPFAIGWIIGANMNTTADQQFTMAPNIGAKFQITSIAVTNAPVSTSGAIGGIYSLAGKAGDQICPAGFNYNYGGLYANSNSRASVSTNTVINQKVWTSAPYLSLTTPLGSAATSDLYLFGNPMNGANPT